MRRGHVREDDYARTYRIHHPIALCLGVGIALTGALSLLAPSTVEETPTSLALPHWLRLVFYAFYTLGGAVMATGVYRAERRLEAAGEVLLAAALIAQYLAILYVRPASGYSAAFLIALVAGLLLRAYRLATNRLSR